MRANHAASGVISKISIRPLTEEDSGRVAVIHREVFPDTPSARLGYGYCRRLYAMYATENRAFGRVLLQEGEAVGFVVGGDKGIHEMISKKLRSQAALSSIVRPSLLLSMAGTQIGKRFKNRERAQTLTAQATNVDRKKVSKLFLIGILAKARGTGGARQLLDSFVEDACSRGYDTVVLNVHRDNARARNAYEKAGWILNDRGGESVEYHTANLR